MKIRMKKISCILLALMMSCQPISAAAQAPAKGQDDGSKGKESSSIITDEQEIEQRSNELQESKVKESKQEKEESKVLPPQMGWSSWNFFKQNINEEKIREVGHALIDSKLNEKGYVYLNMDDCWQSSMRDEQGRMQFDLTSFPSGPAFIKELNGLAGEESKFPLKVGVYSSSGDYTCEDLTASYGNEEKDAQSFAEWGVEYLKYDYCHVIDLEVDSGFITIAPEVDYITVAKANTPEGVKYEAEYAKLDGNASNQGWYVTGLNKAGGSITYENITVPEAGRYVMSIVFRKTASKKKFAEIVVNDSAKYETTIAPTSGWNNTGRQQLYIDLEAGQNTIKIHNPIGGQKDDTIRRYTKMGNALKKATAKVAADNNTEEKPVFYSVCEHGRTEPWTWAQEFAGSWRISGDINASWNTIVSKYDIAANLWQYQRPGVYNDPDMLEVGNGSLTKEENKAHFTLWCMLSSPLILGNDVRSFVKEDGTIDRDACNGAYDIVTNKELIEVNQAQPLLQCKRVVQKNNVDVLVKPLADGEIAVCFFNRGASATTASYDLGKVKADDSRVELPESSAYMAMDLWDANLTESITAESLDSGTIPGHGVKVFRVRAADAGDAEKLTGFKLSTESTVNTGETFAVSAEVENLGTARMNAISVALNVPEGFTAEPVGTITDTLTTGNKATMTWNVTAPAAKGTGKIQATLSFKYNQEEDVQTKTLEKNITIMEEPEDSMFLGDMEWLSASDGWKTTPARNKSIGGNKIKIQGVTYEKGVGTNAESNVKVYLGGKDYRFTAVAGIDDEAIDDYNQTGATYQPPQVTFELLADGKKIYDSGLINMDKPKTEIDVTISDCSELVLHVTEGGNTNAYDHADWANAKFENIEGITEYDITVDPTENGSITTNPSERVQSGGQVEITFTPDSGYKTGTAMVNGQAVTLTGGKYLLTNVSSNVRVGAEFVVEEKEENVNIALEATASSPAKTSAGSGPERANDDSIDTTQNGFSILEAQEDAVKYLQYNWAEGKDLESLEFMTTYGSVRGAEECEILISHDGQEFESLALWSGMTWTDNDNVIESNIYKLTDEEKGKAKNIKGMRLQIRKAKYEWDSTVIMELKAMGKTHVPEIKGYAFQMTQPSIGGTITASVDGNNLESGGHIESGKEIVLKFTPGAGYSLKAAYVNEEQAEVLPDNTYRVTNIDSDITVSAEFEANTITGTVDMTAAGITAEGLNIQLRNESGETSGQVQAKSDGTYLFTEVAHGQYTVGMDETDRYTVNPVNVSLDSQTAAAAPLVAVMKPADKSALEGLITELEKLDLSSYTTESAEQLKSVITEAKKLAEMPLTVDDTGKIEAMMEKLNSARNGLQKKPADKSALEGLISQLEKMDLSSYTTESVNQLKSVIAEAKTLAAMALTIDDMGKIETMIERLNTAKNELKKKPEPDKTVGTPNIKVKNINYKNVELKWNKVQNATGYEVYRQYKKGKWDKLKDVKNKYSYQDKKAVMGRTFQYAVKAYRMENGKKIYGEQSKPISGKAMPATPKTTAKNTSRGKVTVSWKKVSEAQKYVVYRKTTSKKAKWVKLGTVKGNIRTYVDNKAIKGKTYLYAVRTYRKSSGKVYYSSYGETKKVMIKK